MKIDGEIGTGRFGSGFLAGGVSSFAPVPAGGQTVDETVEGAVESAALGGVGSVLGGGKFQDGAITGAFGYLFNEAAHHVRQPLTNQQIANIIFNETQSFSGPDIDQARENIALVIIYDELKIGYLPQMSSDIATVPASENQIYQEILQDVRNAQSEYQNGEYVGTNFNFRPNSSTGPFFGLPLITNVGPLNNSYPTNQLPQTGDYANTYGKSRQ